MKIFLSLFIAAGLLAAQTATGLLEFTVFKGRGSVKVGPIDLTLRGTDVNKQRYAFDMVVEGHKIEKKDLDIKVPFYFYVASTRYELLVTKVAKDQITGWLASPK